MKSQGVRIFLLVLLVNIIISYFIGVKYKDSLITFLTPPLYYQSVVLLSLTTPMIITKIYQYISKSFTLSRLKKFKKKASTINTTEMDEPTKQMYETLIKDSIPMQHEIKELHELMKEHYK